MSLASHRTALRAKDIPEEAVGEARWRRTVEPEDVAPARVDENLSCQLHFYPTVAARRGLTTQSLLWFPNERLSSS